MQMSFAILPVTSVYPDLLTQLLAPFYGPVKIAKCSLDISVVKSFHKFWLALVFLYFICVCKSECCQAKCVHCTELLLSPHTPAIFS